MAINYIYKPKVSNVFCDKCSITLKIKNEDHEGVKTKIQSLLDDGYAKLDHNPQYKLSVNLGIGVDNENTVLIQCSPHPHLIHHSYFRIEFNPASLGPKGVSDMKFHLDNILPNGYESLIQDGMCTRFDATIDIKNMPIEKLVFRHPKIQLTKAYYKKDKAISSYYLGGDKNKKQFCIYDKVAEIKNYNLKHWPKKTVPKDPVTRIEVTNKYRKPMKDLINIDNQFSKLEIYFLNRVKKYDLEFEFFLDSVRLRGLQSALYKVDSQYKRKKYLARMESAKNKYWKPEKHWASWPNVVNKIYQPMNPKIHNLPVQLMSLNHK